MNGFIDLTRVSKARAKEIAQGALDPEFRESQMMVSPLMEEFHRFLIETLRATHARFIARKGENFEPRIDIDYDPKQEPERFIKDGWNLMADIWPVIETVPTYQLTMMTILEKLKGPDERNLRLVSIGSGPGIYETFLARLFQLSGMNARIYCVDLAPEMTELNQFIINLNPPQLRNIETLTSDMADIKLPDGCADVVLCNNALQWSKQWRKAIGEMARLLDPKSVRLLHLIVHTHKQEMHMGSSTGEKIIDMEPVLVPDILDELEKQRFKLHNTRQLKGSKGTGQLGTTVDRAFIEARLLGPGERPTSWRNAKTTVKGAGMYRLG